VSLLFPSAVGTTHFLPHSIPSYYFTITIVDHAYGILEFLSHFYSTVINLWLWVAHGNAVWAGKQNRI